MPRTPARAAPEKATVWPAPAVTTSGGLEGAEVGTETPGVVGAPPVGAATRVLFWKPPPLFSLVSIRFNSHDIKSTRYSPGVADDGRDNLDGLGDGAGAVVNGQGSGL